MRDPYAAATLIRELRAVVPKLIVERDDLDGLDVYRTFRFTSTEKAGLDDVITAVADDRIVQTRSIKDGVEVTFTHFVHADQAKEFGVSQVADELLTKPRRRAAKKTAASGTRSRRK